MNTNTPKPSPLIPVIRWIARMLSLALVILLMIIAFGESWNSTIPWAHLRPLELGIFAALSLALFGLLAAWRWELAGASINMAGVELYLILLWIRDHAEADFGYEFNIFTIIALNIFGLMFLFCWWSDRRRSASHPN